MLPDCCKIGMARQTESSAASYICREICAAASCESLMPTLGMLFLVESMT